MTLCQVDIKLAGTVFPLSALQRLAENSLLPVDFLGHLFSFFITGTQNILRAIAQSSLHFLECPSPLRHLSLPDICALGSCLSCHENISILTLENLSSNPEQLSCGGQRRLLAELPPSSASLTIHPSSMKPVSKMYREFHPNMAGTHLEQYRVKAKQVVYARNSSVAENQEAREFKASLRV